MKKINLGIFEKKIKKKIEKAENLKELDEIFKEVFGKDGEIKKISKIIPKLPKTKRKVFGEKFGKLKENLMEKLEKRAKELKEKIEKEKEEKEWIDITIPPKKAPLGHYHPISLVKRKIEGIFQSMGFEVVEGPEIEDEWHNFDALNIPKDHPARDILSLGKTFYLKGGGLMRSHTSSVQIRYMEKNQPPLRIIVPGRVFRLDAIDASHEIDFWQLEGLMVGKDVSVANFKAVIEEFLKKFFEKEVKIRLRPSYFPFTEPSFEVDISCVLCGGKGCQVCKNSGWLECGGAGMVHPNVYKNCGLDPKEWQGFAFGFGINRLAMLKYKIPDIRLFNSGDLRFLNQF
jgi:phenylalanyl-tRNA synthetase alpha chain